jgi:hypothetical protein
MSPGEVSAEKSVLELEEKLAMLGMRMLAYSKFDGKQPAVARVKRSYALSMCNPGGKEGGGGAESSLDSIV